MSAPRRLLVLTVVILLGEVAAAQPPASLTVSLGALPGLTPGAPDLVFQAIIIEGFTRTVGTGVPVSHAAPRGQPLGGWVRTAALRKPDLWSAMRARPVGEGPGEATGPVTIDHEDVACVVAGKHPALNACLAPDTRVGRAQVWFRSVGQPNWYAVDLLPEGRCYQAYLPKPKATLQEFEYYVRVLGTDYAEATRPETAPDKSFRVRVVGAEGGCDMPKRMARGVLRVAAPIVIESAAGALVPDGFGTEGVVPAATAAGVQAAMVATGASSGAVFQLHAVGPAGRTVRLVGEEGLILQPAPRGGQPPTARGGAGLETQTVTGYCLDFPKPPPAPGTLYRVADAPLQARFRGLGRLLRTARSLAGSGRLHPDSEPAGYADSIKQWALWAQIAGWDEAQFGAAFMERTKKNVQELKRPWTKEMETAVRAAVPGRWRDIRQVRDDAKGP